MLENFSKSKIVAVLGPTNTGKTYLAMERLLGHSSGMIGFPLRLLARENYDRAVRLRGPEHVALITGEEKIIPAKAKWWICTVESMPIDKKVDFLAVDEIQLAANPERGHIFTQRLMHARGLSETMFMGADTIRSLLRCLLPGVEYIDRPRMSVLSHVGHQKLSRLPKRSAIIAFSFEDVYRIADLLRHQSGGTSIVMGGLSPRTRNAQVEMYQAGEVDYLVATDAIGMGLNMDIHHVAFAKLKKFDGRYLRRLEAPELAQIAGRAGRQLTNGSFGTTENLDPLEQDLVESIENHRFDMLQQIQWRNHQLEFRSPLSLLQSLDKKSPYPFLRKSSEADDYAALLQLSKDPEIASLCKNYPHTFLLWDVCQIPDFRKIMTDAHTQLLKQVFLFLYQYQHIPKDWVASQIERLNHVDGDIDALMARLGHIRTWTYIAYRPNWLANPLEWQERTRAIEDKLSDALHRQLTQRFVDRRRTVLTQQLHGKTDILAGILKDGQVIVEGYPIGWLQGFRFVADSTQGLSAHHQLHHVARRALRQEIDKRIQQLRKSPDHLHLTEAGEIVWEDTAIAQLTKGKDILTPQLRLIGDDLLEPTQQVVLTQHLHQWLATHLQSQMPDFYGVIEDSSLPPLGKGLLFQLQQSLGFMTKNMLREMWADLLEFRPILARHRMVFSDHAVWLKSAFQGKTFFLRHLLWKIFNAPAQTLEYKNRPLFYIRKNTPAFCYEALGYHLLKKLAVRADILERIDRYFKTLAAKGDFQLKSDLLGQFPAKIHEFALILAFLGYQKHRTEEGDFYKPLSKPVKTFTRNKFRPVNPHSPFANLKDLLAAK